MKILFLGQLGIPASAGHTREKRIEAIATNLASAGHEVAATCAKPFVSPNIRRFNGVELLHSASLNPQKPGGSLYTLLSLRKAMKWKPDVVHVHGFMAAFLVRLAPQFRAGTTCVWTIDALPRYRNRIARWFMQFLARAFESISFPSRQIQYHVLAEFGVRGTYIPDGFSLSLLLSLPLREWGVRKGQYVLFLGGDAAELKWLQRALKRAKSSKSVTQMDENLSTRQHETLIKGAAAIVAGSDSAGNDVLISMALGKPIIATSHALNEELLGTTGWVVKAQDTPGLAEALQTVFQKRSSQPARLKQSKKRALHHFSWERITPEYIGLYHAPLARLVPLDSAHAPRFTQLPA